MRSKGMPKFWDKYHALPKDAQQRARRAYKLWVQNPNARGLFFKLIIPKKSIYSIRIGLHYRALGILRGDTIYWYWIGPHDEYDNLI